MLKLTIDYICAKITMFWQTSDGLRKSSTFPPNHLIPHLIEVLRLRRST